MMRRELLHSRAWALVAFGAFLIHQLHFLLVSGSAVGEDLRQAGHSYLGHVPSALAALAVVLVAGRLVFAYFGLCGHRPTPRCSPLGRGALFALAVFALFFAQEIAEALLFAHHAEGMMVALGQGCWLTLVLSACIGPILLLLDSWMGRVEYFLTKIGGDRSASPTGMAALSSYAVDSFIGLLSPLAFGLARRPPPLISARL